MILRTLSDILRTESRKAYFSNAKDEIASQNLRLFRSISITTTFLIVFFILLTPQLIPSWHLTPEYLYFAAFSVVFSCISIIAYKNQWKKDWMVTLICVLFNIHLSLGMIIIDVFPYPDSGCVFIPMFFSVCPALFIFPYKVYHPLLIGSELLFVFLSQTMKPGPIAASDTFRSVVGLFFGFCLSFIVTNIRVGEYEAKTNYRNLSQIDGLTGLLNKSTCESMVRHHLSHRDRAQLSALLILDIDNFKSINDSFGHDVGDSVLADMGTLLSGLFRTSDVVGRFGGDEFIILMKNIPNLDLLDKKCKQLNSAARSISTGDNRFKVTCSIGASVTTSTVTAYDDLFRMADDALYEAKNFGRNRYVVHCPSTTETSSEKPYMLVVDDVEVNRAILSASFADDFDILEAPDGKQALVYLSQYASRIAIVLLDIYMPDLNGYDVLHFMKSRTHTQRIPVIVISSDSNSEAKALSEGADDMIQKPINADVAKLRVNKILGRN